MSNKFLDLYPQLWIPKLGDKVKIIKLLNGDKQELISWHYCIGDIGVIVDKFHNFKNEYVYKVYFDKYKGDFGVFQDEIELDI